MASHKNLFISGHSESSDLQNKNHKMLDLWNLQNICPLKICTIIVKLLTVTFKEMSYMPLL